MRSVAAALVAVLATAVVVAVPTTSAQAVDYSIGGALSQENTPGAWGPAGSSIIVSVYSVTGNGFSDSEWFSGGAWSMSVPEGRYRVSAKVGYFTTPGEFVPWAPTWYGDTPFEFDSPVVTVSGPVTGIDLSIGLGSSISGTMNHKGDGAVAAYLWSETANRFLPEGFEVTSHWQTGAYQVSGLPEGRYLLRFFLMSSERFGGYYWGGVPYPDDAVIIEVGHDQDLTGYDMSFPEGGLAGGRLAGSDRFATSVEVSKAFFGPETDSVFIVNGLNFPDALSAGPAAALEGAPVLLVTPTSIPDSVRAEIARLDPENIYIVGGTPSVSNSVATQLGAYGTVERIAGSDRFETSRKVASRFFADADVYTAYFATGLNFPDALGAGPAAAFEGGPLVLINGGASTLDVATTSLIGSLDINRAVVAGSAAVVSDGIMASLNAQASMDEVVRQGGADRFGTAFEIANGDNIDGGAFHYAETVFLATGYGFPDALAASSVAAQLGAPIYLVQPNCVPGVVINEIFRLSAKEVILLGSSATLGAGVENFTVC